MLKHGVCKISASRSVSLVITYIRSQRFTPREHYSEVIMGVVASQITGVSIVYSTVWSGVDHRKYQSSASLVFVRGIHRWPVTPITRKMFSFDDVIMRPSVSYWYMISSANTNLIAARWLAYWSAMNSIGTNLSKNVWALNLNRVEKVFALIVKDVITSHAYFTTAGLSLYVKIVTWKDCHFSSISTMNLFNIWVLSS